MLRQPISMNSPILANIANTYPGGVNSPQYQFALTAINSSPDLLEIINQYQIPITLSYNPVFAGQVGGGDPPYLTLEVNKSVIDDSYLK